MYINIYESKQFLENILFSIICVLLFIYMYTNPNRHAFLFFVFVYRYLLTLVYILLSCNFNCFSFIFTKIEFVVLNQAGNNFCYSSIKRHALRSPPRYIIAIWFRKLCECLCAHMCNIYIYIYKRSRAHGHLICCCGRHGLGIVLPVVVIYFISL